MDIEETIIPVDMFNKSQKHQEETDTQYHMDWIEEYGVDTENFAKYDIK